MRLNNDFQREAQRFEDIDRALRPEVHEDAEPCYGQCDGCPRMGPIFNVAGKYWLCETCKALPDGAA